MPDNPRYVNGRFTDSNGTPHPMADHAAEWADELTVADTVEFIMDVLVEKQRGTLGRIRGLRITRYTPDTVKADRLEFEVARLDRALNWLTQFESFDAETVQPTDSGEAS